MNVFIGLIGVAMLVLVVMVLVLMVQVLWFDCLSVGLLVIDVTLNPYEVMHQVAELTALGVLVEHMNGARSLVLADVDLATWETAA